MMHSDTVNSSSDVERKTSFLVSLNNDLYDLPTTRPDVAAYEEPVVSLSQYETIGDGEVCMLYMYYPSVPHDVCRTVNIILLQY